MSRIATFILGAGIGAAASHFLDPDNGRRRRHQAVGKTKGAAGKAKGAVATATPTISTEFDDVSLARKVETEVFRDADAPKGEVSVDVQAGVAYLRGEVTDEAWIARLADEASKVDGIKGVENLLHPQGTPAPAAEPRGAIGERL